MKKIFMQFLSGIIVSSMLLSSACAFADDEFVEDNNDQQIEVSDSVDAQVSDEQPPMELSDVGDVWNVIRDVNCSDTAPKIQTGSGSYSGQSGLTLDKACTDAPVKNGDPVLKYTSQAVAQNYSETTMGLTYGEFVSFNNDSSLAAALEEVYNRAEDNKIIIEFDILSMYDNTGMFIRTSHKSGGGAANTYDNAQIVRAGKEINKGEWTKVDVVMGTKSTDKNCDLYINGEHKSNVTMNGYGIYGSNKYCMVIPFVKKGLPFECYIDNVRIIEATSMKQHNEASIGSDNAKITVEDKTINGFEYGSTVSNVLSALNTDGLGIFAVDKDGYNLDDDAFIDSETKFATVSSDEIYTYYNVNIKYIPGDIYKKIAVTKQSPSSVVVKNLDDIADSTILIYSSNNGVTYNDVYAYSTNNKTEITCTLSEPADATDDINVILVNNVSNFNTLNDAENSGIKIDLAVESGATVSGNATAGSDAYMFIVNPNESFDNNALLQDGTINNYYVVSTAKANDEGKYTFDLVPFTTSGIYTYIIYADGKAYKTTKFAPGRPAIIEFKTKISQINDNSDLKAILDADSLDGNTGLEYTYYNLLTDAQKLKVCGDIIGAMDLIGEDNVNLDTFGTNLKYRSMIPAMVKKITDDATTVNTIYNLLDTKNEIFNLSGSAVNAYDNMTESDKKKVCEYIYKFASKVTDSDGLQNTLDASVINLQLDKNVTHADAYTILNSHINALTGLKISDYSKLTTEKVTVDMVVLNKRPYASTASLVTTVNDAIDKAKEAEDDNDSSGSGSSGGGRTNGNTSFTSTTPIISGNVNTDIGNVFSDINDVQWAQEAINKLNKMNIISGRGNGVFDPNGKITREEFVKMVVEAAGLSSYNVPNTFSDVDATQWYNKYVSIAAENGITSGMGDNIFGIGQNITRQDMMVMTMYLLPSNSVKANITGFKDAEEIADYAKEAVCTLEGLNIVTGNENGYLLPSSDCTRAEAAKIIYMVLKLKNNY